MLSRRLMLGAILGAPQIAKASLAGAKMALQEKSLPIPEEYPGPVEGPVEASISIQDRLLNKLRIRAFEAIEEDHDIYVMRRKMAMSKFSDMKSWSRQFREKCIIEDVAQRNAEREALHRAISNANLRTLIKVAKELGIDYREVYKDLNRRDDSPYDMPETKGY